MEVMPLCPKCGAGLIWCNRPDRISVTGEEEPVRCLSTGCDYSGTAPRTIPIPQVMPVTDLLETFERIGEAAKLDLGTRLDSSDKSA